jgi:hypothetical protein
MRDDPNTPMPAVLLWTVAALLLWVAAGIVLL